MSVTKMAVFIGIMCSVWMTSPLTANAFEKFVGLSDRGSTKVKTCVEDVDDVERQESITFPVEMLKKLLLE